MQDFISAELQEKIRAPISYRPLAGGTMADDGERTAFGYDAEALPLICEAIQDAYRAGKASEQLATAANVIHRGLARVGISALVDEATGYQADRARDALARILEKFIAKELQPWVRTFQAEFYEHMFRLWGIPYDAAKPKWKRPSFFGHLTNNLVYARLAPGVLVELRKLNPITENGRRDHTHHQHLTRDTGHPKLREHLSAVVALMKASRNKDQFLKMMDSALPKHVPMPLFDRIREQQSQVRELSSGG